MTQAICCHTICSAPAHFHLATGTGPDDYTHACWRHIAQILPPGGAHVMPLIAEESK